jgi:hypothetical protein
MSERMFAILLTAIFVALLVVLVIVAGCPDPVCRNGVHRCVDNKAQRCVGGEWRIVMKCNNLLPRGRVSCGVMRGEIYCEGPEVE